MRFMDQREVESKLAYINEFQRNVARSMSIRLKIDQDRIKAQQLFERNSQSEEAIGLLKRCIKNERWFMRTIKEGLKNSRENFSEINGWIQQNAKDKEVKSNSQRLLDIVNIFESKVGDIEHRLALEELFVERKDEKSWLKFRKQWEKEIALNKKLLRKISDINRLQGYYQKMQILMKNKGTVALSTIFGVGGGVVYYANFAGRVQLTQGQLLTIIGGFFALGLAFSTAIVWLTDAEKKVQELQLAELERVKAGAR